MLLRAGVVAVLLVLGVPATASSAVTIELVRTGHFAGSPGAGKLEGAPPRDLLELRVTGTDAAEDILVDDLRFVSAGELAPGGGCVAEGSGAVVCDPGDGASIEETIVDLGGGDDRIRLGAPAWMRPTVRGGPGNDVLVATARSGVWDGGPGADRLEGGAGWSVSFEARTTGVAASLDGVANDGAPGEGDDIGSDAPVVVGGAGPDVLVGGKGQVRLLGGAGDDTLRATGTATGRTSPADTFHLGVPDPHSELVGGDGADRLLGGPGPDFISGEAGDDTVAGGPGPDSVTGGAGADRYDGGLGDDRLGLQESGDGDLDVVAGGPGRDLVAWQAEVRPAHYVVRLDGRGPDGPRGESDRVVSDVEDVEATGRSVDLSGDAGPNLLRTFATRGSVVGGAGDDELVVTDRLEGDVRVVPGRGADVVRSGEGNRIDARDGQRDRIHCSGVQRALRLDRRLDRAVGCVAGVSIDDSKPPAPRTVRAGRWVSTSLWCEDPFHPCRVRVRFVLTRPDSWQGRTLARRTTVLDGPPRRLAVRVPRDAPTGRRVVRVLVERVSPFPGAPSPRDRGSVPIRIRR